jgi:biopolymer transport protein ExbD
MAAEKLRGKTLPCPRCRSTVQIPVLTATDLLPSGGDRQARAQKKVAQEKVAQRKKTSHSHVHGGPDPFNPPRNRTNPSDLIDMTAMVDIVFFLLIYFLVTSFVALVASVHAPSTQSTVGRVARNSSDTPEGTALTVRIDQDDVIWIEQEAVFAAPEVHARLKSTREVVGADRLRISASSDATHGKLVLVLDAGVAAGFKSAQLAIAETP